LRRTLLKSKIHRATVTGAELHYVGSLTLDRALMAAADIADHERVEIYDVTNGARLATYAVAGGPGEVIVNGAAAHLAHQGDLVIICTYAEYDEAETAAHRPKVLMVDAGNRRIAP